MITQFENGFITKGKLNELVDGINANAEDISGLSSDLSNLIIEINAKVLTANISKTVGIGGDFTTLTEALEWCKLLNNNGYIVTLKILTGYIFNTQISLLNANLSFVIIEANIYTDEFNCTLNSGTLLTLTNAEIGSMRIKINGTNTCAGLKLNTNSKLTFDRSLQSINRVYSGMKNFLYYQIEDNSSLRIYTCDFSNTSVGGGFACLGSKLEIFNTSLSYANLLNSSNGTITSSEFRLGGNGLSVNNGSIARVGSNTNETLSQTANTITANGIIFK